jgi:hypothetical protein
MHTLVIVWLFEGDEWQRLLAYSTYSCQRLPSDRCSSTWRWETSYFFFFFGLDEMRTENFSSVGKITTEAPLFFFEYYDLSLRNAAVEAQGNNDCTGNMGMSDSSKTIADGDIRWVWSEICFPRFLRDIGSDEDWGPWESSELRPRQLKTLQLWVGPYW